MAPPKRTSKMITIRIADRDIFDPTNISSQHAFARRTHYVYSPHAHERTENS